MFYFVSYPPSSLNGTQPKPATCSEVSAILNCMSENWGIQYPPPTNRGPINNLFSTIYSQLNGNFNGLYLRNGTRRIHNRASTLETTIGLLYRLKLSLSTNGLRLDRHFYPLCKFGSLLHCHASQTGMSKRNST